MKATIEIFKNKLAYEEVLGNSTSKGVRVAKVFESKRPIANGNVLGDISWRMANANSDTRVKTQALKAAYAEILNVPVESVKVSFSKYCGCSACPCSPGWDVYLSEDVFSAADHKPVCSSVSFE